MSKGGKREGAGAKPRTSSPTTMRGVRFNDEEWDFIAQKFFESTDDKIKTISDYIRFKALSE